MTNKVPNIRFKGFTDDWEQRKLESLCEVFTDGDWIEAKDQSNSGVRLIQTGNIGITEYLDKENNKKWISEETLKRLRCEEVHPGDILISRLPDPAGRACILPNLGIRMITAVDCTIIRTSKEYDSKYLVQYLSTPTYFKIVNSFLGGGTRQRISRKNLSKIDIPVPHIFAEQQKIGEYFSNLDHLITLHQRKCEQTKELKKFMLQKMFPKKGEKNPEIRFPGFTDDWEQRKLESLCEVFTDGDWIEAKDQSNSGVRLIQTGNIGITEYLDKENNKKWISEETLKRLRCEEVHPGDILISRLPDPAGRACILPNLGIRMITAVDCTIIRTSKEYDSKYLVQYLSTPTYFKIVNSFLGGGTRQRISRKNLSKIDIPVPHIFAEQQKIGEYFSNLDHLITLHQRKCEQLKELKKFMLQNMFPKKG
ncbi:MAG: restriction endonuclease subunit S [Streptococcus sp.]|nr:restriction endonuclease subunit S [Streptococcus sp.]